MPRYHVSLIGISWQIIFFFSLKNRLHFYTLSNKFINLFLQKKSKLLFILYHINQFFFSHFLSQNSLLKTPTFWHYVYRLNNQF
jgi:hypothetical protein